MIFRQQTSFGPPPKQKPRDAARSSSKEAPASVGAGGVHQLTLETAPTPQSPPPHPPTPSRHLIPGSS